MTTHVDRLEVSSSPALGMASIPMLAAPFLSSPVEEGETNLRTMADGGLPAASLFLDHPLRNEPEIHPMIFIEATAANLVASIPPIHGASGASGEQVEAVGCPEEERLFPPLADAGLCELMEGLPATERQVLREVYGTFLSLDDPYLEANDISVLAERLRFNERQLRDILAHLGRSGLLRLARSAKEGEIELAESTARGMEAFCRAFHAGVYVGLLEEVSRAVVGGGIVDGPSLCFAFPAQPGLLLNHVVETLAREGWLECSEQFGGSCGCQIGRVSPGLHAWAAASLNAK